MSIQTKVASLGASRGGLSVPELLARQQASTDAFGSVPAPLEDQVANAQDMVQEYEPRPLDVPARNLPPEMALAEASRIETPQDVAAASYSQFGARPVQEPVFNSQNQLEVDPETNELRLRTIGPEDYNNQLFREKAGQRLVSGEMHDLAMQPFSGAKTAMSGQLKLASGAAFDASARETSKVLTGGDEIERTADKAQSGLAQMVSYASNSLFTANGPIKIKMEHNGIKVPIAAGLLIASEEGYHSPEDQAPISLAFGAGLIKAASQGKLEKGEKEDKRSVLSPTGAKIDDAMYLNDFINGVKHYAGNALDRMGVKMSPKAKERMAKAIVMSAVHDGNIPAFHYGDRVVVQIGKDFKGIAKATERTLEVIAGDYNRRRSSTTPNRSGSSFAAGGQQMTRKSLRRGGIDTTAAEATKDILGSIALYFDPKDVQYKEIEYSMITDPQYLVIDDQTGEPKYSTHWAAQRNGVSEKDYKAAIMKTHPKKDFDKNNPNDVMQHEANQKKQASEIINEKLKSLKFDIDNAKGSQGLRYSEWIHSLANQRFFPNSFDVDYMGSKSGVRDMLGFGKRDLTYGKYLFDDKPNGAVENIKGVANRILRLSGEAQNKALLELNPLEGAAIGTMLNVVIAYYSAVNGSQPDIVKEAPATIVSKYTPDMAKALAAVGREYNQFLKDPANAGENIQRLLAGMEKGESMGSKNLWDDMARLEEGFNNPQTANIPMILSHHSFDDGNQNGIFLQSLFYGNSDNALRLGTFNPSLDDMREYAMNTMLPKLEDYLKDQPEKMEAWNNFFNAMREKYGKANMAKEFFKKPLMQTSYGKDAGMFGEHLLDLLADQFYEQTEDTLGSSVYKDDIPSAAEDLNAALTLALREVVNSDNSRIMGNIGRYTAILNYTVMMEGITGDTYVFTPVEVVPTNKGIDSDQVIPVKLANGQEILIKKKEREADVFSGPDGEEIEVESFGTNFNPSATKGTQFFYDQRTKSYSIFNNAIGTRQSRNFVVMPFQSIDGDLVKLTTLNVNKNREIPLPVLWVHDSIISSPLSGLLYRNTYNNISIPAAIPQIAKFGSKLQQIVNEAELSTIEGVMARGKPVSIGSQGDYPALGAYFDEQYDRIQDNGSYKPIFLKRNKNDVTKWVAYQNRTKALLKEATDAGWKEPGSIRDTDSMNGEYIRAHLAVTPAQFKTLSSLSKEMLQLSGKDNKLKRFVDGFADRVKRTASTLMTAAKENGNGIGQMTYGATGEKGDISKSIPIKPKEMQVPTTIKPVDLGGKVFKDFNKPKEIVEPKFGIGNENKSSLTVESIQPYIKSNNLTMLKSILRNPRTPQDVKNAISDYLDDKARGVRASTLGDDSWSGKHNSLDFDIN